jgi:hypothetical protein
MAWPERLPRSKLVVDFYTDKVIADIHTPSQGGTSRLYSPFAPNTEELQTSWSCFLSGGQPGALQFMPVGPTPARALLRLLHDG